MSASPAHIFPLAAEGLRLFPLVPNGKKPLVEQWQNVATADASQLRCSKEQYRSCDWGLATLREDRFDAAEVQAQHQRAARRRGSQ